MNRRIVGTLAVLAFGTVFLGGCKKEETSQKSEAPQMTPAPQTTAPAPQQAGAAKTGEELFKQLCVACHADGGNTINPKKTLHRENLAKNNITKPEDIVKIMRNPGTGMNRFDEATLPEKDAMAVAEYVLNTFK